MRNLINFLLRIHFLLLFVLIEVFSIILLINNNNFHKASFVNFSRQVSGRFYLRIADFTKYLSLADENERLVEENARLLNIIESSYKSDEIFFRTVNDTLLNQRYQYTSASVVNNSVNKKHNFLTINKGSLQGIQPEMAVVSNGKIVGVVKGVSKNYAILISLLNFDLKVSAKIKKNGYFGSLSWTGNGFAEANLTEIPLHAEVMPGDTIITSGYSSIYPEGILIGFISDYEEKGGSFYNIKVDLATDFKKINHVQVISNLMQTEKLGLEKETTND